MDNEYMDEPRSEIDWRVVQTMQLGISGLIVFVMVVIWAVTGFGDYFWPVWVWFGLAIPLAVQYAIKRANAGPPQWRGGKTPPAPSPPAGGAPTLLLAGAGGGAWPFLPPFGVSGAL